MDKVGYETLKKEFAVNSNFKDTTSSLVEIPSVFKGRIVDSNGKGVLSDLISIKNNDNLFKSKYLLLLKHLKITSGLLRQVHDYL